ncbi:MAG: DMT family transporter [Paludibacteraceae bacterium]|nr:DMT family transporter [Paludibacteraceae bacterium]
MNYVGETAAVGVAISWTASALFFERAGNSMGSLVLNLLRIGLAIVLLGLATLFTRGTFLPTDAGAQQWIWLSLSGFVGFFLGDLCLFRSYVVVGARMAQLTMTLAPILTALIGFLLLGETLSFHKIMAIMLVVGGIIMAMLGKRGNKLKFNVSFKGFLLALGGAAGQAIGLVFSKKGIGNYDPMAATQIRAITGFGCFVLLLTVIRFWPKVWKAVHSAGDMKDMFWGTVFGPVVGVSLSLFAVQHTSTGIAATLMGLVPIFIIFPSVIILKQKVTPTQIIGSIISVGGSVFFFM